MINAPSNEKNPQKPPRLWALIPCGGSGSRAQSDIPKQYRIIAGKPMVMHTLAAFAQVERLAGGLVVIAEDDITFPNLLEDAKNAIFSIASKSGNTRAKTVFNGLNELLQQGAASTDWVLVHDAARCLITVEQINALIDACLHDEGGEAVGGLLALPLSDTLKSERLGDQAGRVAATLSRSNKWLAQTPQMFRIGVLLDALARAGDLSDASNTLITDESSAMERLGHAPKLVRGSTQNFKVTFPEDFGLAEAILQSRVHIG